MAKQQISVRIDAEVLARVEEYAEGAGITRAGAVERLVVAGLDADRHRDGSGDAEVLAVLRESNADLRMTVSTLTAQLAVKDDQISTLTSLADHAQQLHALTSTKALAPAEAERVTLGERWRRWWSGRS
jgi:hypothetical protein